jgi:hypothetical protein
MGKINLSSLKSHIERANESFQKIEDEKPVVMRLTSVKSPDSIESMLHNTHEMLKNIPACSKTGS